MNYRLTSAILKSVWAIEPRAAVAHGVLLSMLLNGDTLTLSQEPPFLPYAVSKAGKTSDSIDKADKESIAVIPVIGELFKYNQFCGPRGMQTIGQWIKNADNDVNIKGIVLEIDSPGGTVDGTEELASVVKNTKKPNVAHINGMMCSAALWIGTSADEVIASRGNDEVGSIGVMASFADLQPYWERRGVKFHRINADQSKDKNKILYDALEGKYDSYKEEVLNPYAASFIEAVKENRPNSTTDQYTGKVFFAKNVIGSLVDSIGDLDYAIERAFSLHKPEVKHIKI